MNERESHDAAAEALRDIVTHPDRPLPHVDAIGRYVSSVTYAVTHPDLAEAHEGHRRGETQAQ